MNERNVEEHDLEGEERNEILEDSQGVVPPA